MVSGSLGQIPLGCHKACLGLPKGCAEGSTKVLPRFPPSFVVSGSLGQIRLGCHKACLGLPKGCAEGSTKVLPRFPPSFVVSGSLGQIRLGCHKACLGLPKGCAEGSTKVLPRFPPSFVVSGSLGQIPLGLPQGLSWAAKRLRGRFHQSPAKVPPKFCGLWFSGADPSWAATRLVLGCQNVPWKVPPSFHGGCTDVSRKLRKFRDLSGLLGRSLSFPKDPAQGSPITSLHLSLSSFNSFLHFSPTVLALGSSAIANVLGQNVTFVFWDSLRRWPSPPKRFFGVFPKLFCTFVSESPAVFLGKSLLLQKRFCGGVPQLFSTFVSQMAVAS